MKRFLISALTIGGLAALSSAASLNLSYSISPAGSLWQYNMTLSVDTSSSAWSAGMGWDWLIFGDVTSGNTSPLSDFVVTSGFPVGPWTGLTSSGGGHNGPTFSPVTGAFWIPSSASSTLSWSGTSSFHATPGSLAFSELQATGGATLDNWKTMNQLVPEPASFLVLGGLIPLFLRKRSARK